MPELFRDHTPIERHRVGRRRVWVKRDDLYGREPAPPLGKLRGVRAVLADLHQRGISLVGCWDTRVSMLGLGLAACCREFPDIRAIVSFPMGKADTAPPPAAEKARGLGAELFAVPAARINICLAAARRHVEQRGGHMLPFGLDCPEAVTAVAREAARIEPGIYENGTIVLSCGSGVTLAGLLNGLVARPRRLVGISSGRSRKSILRCVRRHVRKVPHFVHLREPEIPYHVALSCPCPFPSNVHYDLKAWKFLAENLESLPAPVFFWNIGA